MFSEKKKSFAILSGFMLVLLPALISATLSEKIEGSSFQRKISNDTVVKGAFIPDGLKSTTISFKSTFPRRIFKPEVQLRSCLILKIKELRRISFESVNR